MSAVLVVLYIPCDNEDETTNLTKNEDSSTAEDRQEDEAKSQVLDEQENASVVDGSRHQPWQQADDNPDNQLNNGDIILQQKTGCERLPLLEHAAESPVVAPKIPEETGRKQVRIADGVKCGEDAEGRDADEPEESAVRQSSQNLDSYSLEDALQDLLDRLRVDNDVWMKTDDETVLQISFLIPISECDATLRALTSFGLGSIPDTSISTFPASFHQVPKPKPQEETEIAPDGTITKSKSFTDEKRSDFIKTIKSRLTVAQVVAAVEGNARATFDFIMLICLASFIAALGLVENSSVVLVASMLISPLMGPILGGVFGFVIQNQKLTWLGVKNAFIGIVLCLLVGFIFGLVVAGVNSHGTAWGGSTIWPTTEMSSRGMTRSLWVGVLIALPSGAGVALSVLGGNVGSLVGVAISASLLPPAVNAGMLWAYSIISAIAPPAVVMTGSTLADSVSTTTMAVNESIANGTLAPPFVSPVPVPPNCPLLEDNAYKFIYSCNMATEAAILGIVSLFLTLLNILCIFVMGVIVLKIKEVAPHTTVSPVTEVFWKKDLPIARDCYKTLKGKDSLDAAKMAKDIAKEWKKTHEDLSQHDVRKSWHYFVKDLEHSATFQDVAELQPTNIAPRRHTLMRSLSLQGHNVLEGHEDEGIGSVDSTPLSASYLTAQSGNSSSNVRHRNRFFYTEDYAPTPSFETPPTSDPDRFDHHLTVQRAQKRRVPRHLKKQHSLTAEIERAVLQNLPSKLGRFTVSTIKEEGEEGESAKKSPEKAPFILKLPEKKSPSSESSGNAGSGSMVVNIEPAPSLATSQV